MTDRPITVSGTNNNHVDIGMIEQILSSLWSGSKNADERMQQLDNAVMLVNDIKPRDAAEGMLVTQMIATHNAAMECFRRAMLPNVSEQLRQSNLNNAQKLTRAYSGHLAALNKHRGQGEQKITVEHVNVHEGGQAIVGHISGKRGCDEK